MSGGKSKSSTRSSTSQSTIASDTSGVVDGDVYQGNIEFSGDFNPAVSDAFSALIDLTNNAITGAGDIATDSIAQAEDIAKESIARVSERAETIDNPDLATLRGQTPLITTGLVLAAIVGIIYVWRK